MPFKQRGLGRGAYELSSLPYRMPRRLFASLHLYEGVDES